MNENQKTALLLILMVLAGSLLGFSPTIHSVTQNARNVQVAFNAENYQTGANFLLEMAAAQPWWTSLWETAGEAAFLAGDHDLAVTAFEGSRERGVLSESGQITLGRAYLNINDPEMAETTWKRLPDSPRALKRLADLYESRGEFPKAIAAWYDFLALSEQQANSGDVLYFGLMIAADSPPKALGYLDQSSTEYSQAGVVAAAIRDAIDQEPAYQLVVAGQALAAEGYWRLAAHAFQKAVQLRPDYQEAWLYWGEALQRLDDPAADPLETLEKGLSLNPEAPLANLFLGVYWQRKGDHQAALDYFQEAETSWPDLADVLVEEGKSLAAQGDLEAALEKYQAAIELEPESDDFYRELALFTISYSYQVKEVGLPAGRYAVQLDPDQPANLDLLGQVLLDLGDEQNALKLFQEALVLDPGFPPANFHLGILYSARDDQDQAVYYLQQALKFSKNPALIDQAERLLSTY